MIFKTMIKTSVVVSSMIGMISLTGCSMNTWLAKEDVTVERINSSSAKITRAYLHSTETTLVLRGELTRRLPARGSIPGHLHVELIGPDGTAFKEATPGYMRKNRKSRFAKFYLPIPGDLTKISRVRITHHDPRSHTTDSGKSPWQDVNTEK